MGTCEKCAFFRDGVCRRYPTEVLRGIADWCGEYRKPSAAGGRRQSPPEMPAALAGDAPFLAAWAAWVESRRQARLKPYTHAGLDMLFKKLATWGPELAVEAIENSLANGYQGLFDPRDRRDGSRRQERRGRGSTEAEVDEQERLIEQGFF